MKQSIDFAFDDHSGDDDDDRAQPLAWSVSVRDDCDACGEPRVELILEEQGRAGTGLAAHLSPDTTRRLRAALGVALRTLGEPPAD